MRKHWYTEAIEKYLETENENDVLEGLEAELKENDDETIWVLEHYTLTASELLENDCDEMDEEEISKQIEMAKKEIELLRRNGYDRYADREAEALADFEKWRVLQ